MNRTLLIVAILATPLAFVAPAYTHCEIPCGIYDDNLRIRQIEEHITTIEKSMKQIAELSRAATVNYNQLIRWVTNKEKHADEIQHVVTQYFMTQRIRPAEPSDKAGYAAYVTRLTLLHRLLRAAMKAKQTTDPAHIVTMRRLLAEFHAAYPTAAPAPRLAPHAHTH